MWTDNRTSEHIEDKKKEKNGLYTVEEERGDNMRKKKRLRFEEDICNEKQGLTIEGSEKHPDWFDVVEF